MSFRLLIGFVAALFAQGAAAEAPPLDWSKLPLPAIEGGALAPETLAGKVVLVVNTASFCGFTPQYEGLQALWERYRGRGLVVLGVPSNDFGGQEPEGEAKIKQFCETAFGIDFPMLAKQTVRGEAAHPFYRWAAEAAGPAGLPRWNFYKYLVGRDGRLLDWFASTTAPDSAKLTKAVEAALR
jgi:glutathione peroxidase